MSPGRSLWIIISLVKRGCSPALLTWAGFHSASCLPGIKIGALRSSKHLVRIEMRENVMDGRARHWKVSGAFVTQGTALLIRVPTLGFLFT